VRHSASASSIKVSRSDIFLFITDRIESQVCSVVHVASEKRRAINNRWSGESSDSCLIPTGEQT
jgi:hypothetical protein